jgi:diacylglycerol kinase (ATP)
LHARPAKRHFVFVIHGARADVPALRHLVSWVRDKGHTVDARVTWETGDAERFAREGVAAGAHAVVAVGGDGTVNEVINGLDGSTTPLGIIPLGTANDFARQAAIPDDADHAMDVILLRKPMLVDTVQLNDRRFLNVSSGGIGAEATAETPQDAKATLGPLAYALTGARKLGDLESTRAHFQGPGFTLECDTMIFAVGNARATGGGSIITPRASITDGLLDLCVIEAMPLNRLAKVLMKIRKGGHLEEEGVHYAQLPSVTITTEHEMSANVDGEPCSDRRFEYRIRPRDLGVYVQRSPDESAEPD